MGSSDLESYLASSASSLTSISSSSPSYISTGEVIKDSVFLLTGFKLAASGRVPETTYFNKFLSGMNAPGPIFKLILVKYPLNKGRVLINDKNKIFC